MIEAGQTAPDFLLPGIERGTPEMYKLFEPLGTDETVLLWLFPSTFLPTATAELCAIRDAGWHDVDGLSVWGVSMDSIYAAAAYADEYDLPMPLLGDGGSAAEHYGVRYEEWEGHFGPPKRAVFLVEPDWTVAHAWVCEDAFDTTVSPVAAVASALGERFTAVDTGAKADYERF
ncbi:MAG: redoxin domain-containing protein [Natronomonas sp.]